MLVDKQKNVLLVHLSHRQTQLILIIVVSVPLGIFVLEVLRNFSTISAQSVISVHLGPVKKFLSTIAVLQARDPETAGPVTDRNLRSKV